MKKAAKPKLDSATSGSRQKPNITDEEWDFRFGPICVESKDGLTSFADHWKETEEALDNYLVQALKVNFLPASVTLAQFISVLPKHTAIDLRTHTAVRTGA